MKYMWKIGNILVILSLIIVFVFKSVMALTNPYNLDINLLDYKPTTHSTIANAKPNFINSYVLTGTLYDVDTGWPLYGKISISGNPIDPPPPFNTVWSNPETGVYSVTLASNITYTLTAQAWVTGYNTNSIELPPLTGNSITNIALKTDDLACTAPGYSRDSVLLLSQDFNNGIPATWTVVDNSNGEGCPWVDGNLIFIYNTTGGSGNFAGINSNICGYWSNNNAELQSPTFDSTGFVALGIEYKTEYRELEAIANVDISNDSGNTWTTIQAIGGSNVYGPSTQFMATLEGVDSSTVQARWHYIAGFDGWWQVDEVRIYGLGACTPLEGGLIVGNVYDNNSLLPLNGATIINDSGYKATSMATPTDNNVDDGFYTIFSSIFSSQVTQTHTFTTTLNLYSDDIRSTEVVSNSTVPLDFYMKSGNLTYNPKSLAVTLESGTIVTQAFTLTNLGEHHATFKLQEIDLRITPIYSLTNIANTHKNIQSNRPTSFDAAPPLTEVRYNAKSNNPQLNLPLTQLIGEPAFGIDIDFGQLIYIPDTTIPSTWNIIGNAGPYYYAGDFLNGDFSKMYVLLGYGSTNKLYSLNTTTSVETIIAHAAPTFGTSWTGMTGAVDGTMYASATDCSTSTLYTIDVTNGLVTTIGDVPNAPCLIDIAINASGEMYGLDIINDNLIKIDPKTANSTIIGHVGFDASYAQSMDFEEDSGLLYLAAFNAIAYSGELRIADTTTGNTVLIGQFPGYPNQVDAFAFPSTFSGVPWLVENPISGTIASSTTANINIVFDASVSEATQPGQYLTQLKINHDTPTALNNIPVTMTVTAPASWGKLQGAITSLGHCDNNQIPLQTSIYLQNINGVSTTIESDRNGNYAYWLDEATSPLTLTVAYPHHISQTLTAITILAGITTTVDVDLRREEPCVNYNFAPMTVIQEAGMSTTLLLTITNTGATLSDFEILEDDGTFIALNKLSFQDILIVNNNSSTVNSFKTALDNLGYTYLEVNNQTFSSMSIAELLAYKAVLYAGVPLGLEVQIIAYLDAGGSFLISSRDFGWEMGNSLLYQTYFQATYSSDNGSYGILTGLDMMTGFEPDISNDPYPDDFTINGPDAFGIFQAPTLNLAALAIERLNYQAIYFAWDYHNIGLSDFPDSEETDILKIALDWLVSGDTPWLFETPITGTLEADTGQAIVDISFDASIFEIIQPGTYHTAFKTKTNDPLNRIYKVPVTMTVTPPASWGKIVGTVTGLGYCDINPKLIKADMVLESSDGTMWTLTTDISGTYQLWLDESYSPLTATINSIHHATQIITDVNVTAAVTTTHNFQLRLEQPCVKPNPTAISITLTTGLSTTLPLTLSNMGAADTPFQLLEKHKHNIQLAKLKNKLSWEVATSLPGGGVRYAYAQCPNDTNSFYIISGIDETVSTTANVWRYDADTNIWNSLADFPSPQSGASAVCDGNYIYVAGGYRTNQFYIYDITANSWMTASPLPRNAWNPAMAVYNGFIYVAGGSDFGTYSNEVNIYEIATDTWINTGAPMPILVDAPGKIQVGQYLYVVGGWGTNYTTTNVSVTQRYDIVANTWEIGPVFNSARADFALAATQDYLYAIGGDANEGDYSDPTDLVEILNISTWPNSYWEDTGNPIPIPLSSIGAGFCTETIAGGEIWAVGGANNNGDFVGDNNYAIAQSCFTNSGDDVPWLWVNPITGTLNADSNAILAVNLFATSDITASKPLTPNIYYAELVIKSDDPLNSGYGGYSVPVTMTVLPYYASTLMPAYNYGYHYPGHPLTYTFILTNTGDITDSFNLSLSDNKWPTMFIDDTISMPTITLSMLPHLMTDTFQVVVYIPVDEYGDAVDEVIVVATSQGNVEAMTMATITTYALPVYGVIEQAPITTLTGLPNKTVTHTINITNTGNTTDTFAITINANWHTSAITTVILPRDTSKTINVLVDTPFTATNGDFDIAHITATSQSDITVFDQITLTTQIAIDYGVIVETPIDTQINKAGTTVTYTVWITNSSDVTDSFTIHTTSTWLSYAPSSVLLAAGEGTSIAVNVEIPIEAIAFDYDITQVTVTSDSDPLVFDSVVLTTTVQGTIVIPGVKISANITSASAIAGDSITYVVTITNAGNMPDTFDISLSGNIWANTTSLSTTGQLAVGANITTSIKVDIPVFANFGETDTVIVTATSNNDSTISASVYLTTISEGTLVINLPTVYLPLILK